jgi:hypothetical protein
MGADSARRAAIEGLESCRLLVEERATHLARSGAVAYGLTLVEARAPVVEEALAGAPGIDVTFEPAAAAELGETVAIRVTLPEELGDVAWVQAAVGRAGSHAADRFTILGTPDVPPGERTAALGWDTTGYRPGAYELVVNVGLTDGSVRWWFEHQAIVTYQLRRRAG